MAFVQQADFELVRNMVDSLNVQQLQNSQIMGTLRTDIGQALTVANQAKQDFEDETKLRAAKLEISVQQLTKQAQEECAGIHQKVATLHQQCVEEVTKIFGRLEEVAKSEQGMQSRLQSLANTEQSVANIEANLKDLYKKCEVSVLDLQARTAALEAGGAGGLGGVAREDKKTKSYIPIKNQMPEQMDSNVLEWRN